MRSGTGASEAAELSRLVARRVWINGLLAHGLVGVIAMLGYFVVTPFNFGAEGTRWIVRLFPILWLVFGFLAATEYFGVKRSFRTVREWVKEDRAPTAPEWRSTVGLARRLAMRTFLYWLAILAAVAAQLLFWPPFHITTSDKVRSLGAALVIAMNASVLSFLAAERAMRPVLARANTLDPSLVPGGIGLSARLALALVAVAGTPMTMVVTALVGATPEQIEKSGWVAVLAVGVGSTMAIALMFLVGRTLTEPLQRLRRAQAAIESGRLDASVPVDERGEMGLVLTGFNQMAAGLRERERIRDVFGRHVGSDVARLAMETDFAAGGQQCDATALFVDIIGSTALAEREDPNAVVDILNRFFEAVVRVVGAEGGFVNKFQGDGALCLFGAPVSHGDHAARGLRAARALALELAPLTEVRAAIGVSSGTMVAGNVGAIDRHEFTVIGDPVNEASRLTEEAKLHPSRVLASDRTIQGAGDAANGWIRGEAIALRGRSQPTITYSPYD